MRRSFSARNRADPRFPWLGPEGRFDFPPPGTWGEDSVIGIGGNLSPGMLVSAYSQGIFPWFGEDDPILWQSPDPRFVLFPAEVHCSSSMRKVIRQRRFEIRIDTAFPEVIAACSGQDRPGQSGTWITEDMVEAYIALHEAGYAHSVEAWQGDELAGGFYGVSLGALFCGESMFHRKTDAAKAAFIPFVWRLADEGFSLVDSQAETRYMAGLGARNIPRAEYLRLLAQALDAKPTLRGSWRDAFPGFPDSAAYRELMADRSN